MLCTNANVFFSTFIGVRLSGRCKSFTVWVLVAGRYTFSFYMYTKKQTTDIRITTGNHNFNGLDADNRIKDIPNQFHSKCMMFSFVAMKMKLFELILARCSLFQSVHIIQHIGICIALLIAGAYLL